MNNNVKIDLFNKLCAYIPVLSLGLVLSVDLVDAQHNQSSPNIIILFTDNQGTLDVNIYGSDDLHTPHKNALADRGVKFSQFYAAVVSTTDEQFCRTIP
ncbi:MAG: hypothetical protein EA359_13750 [Balneolaceae bacterium]|nr:MAG: hypothetical protein EA359_13750 [Balneolaceae bacterium]